MAQSIYLNMIPKTSTPRVYLSQYDVGETIDFILFYDAMEYTPPVGATVKVQGTKPSGFGYTVTATVDDNVASIEITEDMTGEAGNVISELVVTESGNIIGSKNFIIEIEKSPHPNGIIDGNAEEVIPELTQLVERVEDAASSVLDRQTVTNTLPAGSQASYSFDEETNTQTFGIPQGEAGAGAVDVTASAYSSSKTYAVGDYVIHNDYLYRCTTAITTAEAWTSGHWTQVVLADDVSDVKSALNDTQADVFDAFEVASASSSNGWKLVANTGLCVSDSDYMLVKYAATAGEIYKVECDHLFQFQNSSTVPSSAPNKRIGNTFGEGTYYVKAPAGATYLIGSSPKVGSTFKVYKTASRVDSAFNGVIESSTLLYLVGAKDMLVNDAYLNQLGKAISSSYYKTSNFIPVKAGDIIKYNLNSNTSTSVICFYNDASENAFVSYIAGTAETSSGTFTAPSNGFIKASTATSALDDSYCYIETDVTPNLVKVSEFDEIKGDVIDDNLTLYALGADALLTNGAYLKQDGTTVSTTHYKTSDFIRVKQGQVIKYNLDSNTTTAVLCFYSHKSVASLVSYVAGTASLSSGTFTVPSDGYIKFSTTTASIPSAYCYIEAEPSPNYTKTEYTPPEKTLNVLLLGDSIFGNDGEIAGFLNSMCASCVNGAFGGTRATSRGSGDWQYFDGVNIVQALASQTWTDQDAAAANLYDSYHWITARLEGLKAVDMSEVDVICMDWGTNDYTSDCTISQITTAYNDIIDTLQTAFPEIRIIICTPIWRCWGDESDNVNGDNHAEFEGGPTLKEIANAIEQFAKDKRISVLNSYQNMPLSYKTRDTYFDAIGSGNTGTAYTHLNVFGNEVYAHLIRGKIVSIF